jgi:hypothetical protein
VTRLADLARFYELLGELETKLGGKRTLGDWIPNGFPTRGVYFFFEPGELRTDSGAGPRVVRVGTHALTAGSTASLRQRLSNHRGSKASGGGNHRGSIFRLLIGNALIRSEEMPSVASWGNGTNIREVAEALGAEVDEVRRQELPLEITVSNYIRSLPFVWLPVADEPGSGSDRGLIERNTIALLSNYERPLIDAPSSNWLGQHCDRRRVQLSGLWNNRHVDEDYDAAFLKVMKGLLREMSSRL